MERNRATAGGADAAELAGLSVEMLPARHGDGLWVEWGPDDDRRRMIIDGGTKAAFGYLQDKLNDLPSDHRHIDLLVVTHIDLDHIEAPIELLRTPVKGATIGDVWFNDYRHLQAGEQSVDRGGKQGEFLAALLEHREHSWNKAFAGGAVSVPETGPLPRHQLPGGLLITLLSPTPSKLEALTDDWKKAVDEADFSPGDRALAIQLLEQKMGPIAVTRGGADEAPRWGKDSSAANGTSIAFIAEYGNQRWLFAGDAHEDALREGLRRFAREAGDDDRVRLDGFKLPHHGSCNNLSPELLDLIECSHFLVSSNGAYHQHPDEACIQYLVERNADSPTRTHLAFNYRTEFTTRWLDDPNTTSTFDFDEKHQPLSGHTSLGRSIDAGTSPVAEATTSHAASAVDSDAVKVRVYHGSFERANVPVMIGHYENTPLKGAEGFVDEMFGGRLSERHATGGYPGALGTHLHIKAPRQRHPRAGVLVVGLGEYGQLTPLKLAEAVRAALIDYAVAHSHDEDDWDMPPDLDEYKEALSMSSVLLGATGDHGLGVRQSVRAIVKGLADANKFVREKFKEKDGENKHSRFGSLQIWEHRAPEAELTLLSLRVDAEGEADPTRFDPNALPEGVTVERSLIRSDGALSHSIPTDDEEHTWRRISVTVAERDDTDSFIDLRFVSDSRLAGLGEAVHKVERDRLSRLLETSSTKYPPPASLYTTLFELLLPNELKWDLRSAADVKLEVDAHTADIPWEMMSAKNPLTNERAALALRAPLTRQLRGGPNSQVRRAADWRALVIGNPPAGPEWPTLPGAYHEALAVVATLEQADVVTEVDRRHLFRPGHVADAEATAAIEAAFFENEYRIIHIAGHGAFDEDDEAATGVVVGPDVYVTANFIGQLRPVPDLVFLNCCHLGKVGGGGKHKGRNPAEGNFNKLGASVARELIASGVRAVVAAGWAVDDLAASAFATTFYEQMARAGKPFGEAVFIARRAAFRATPDSSSWGAYQCYGDADFRLGIERPSLVPRLPATTVELERRVEELLERMESQGVSSQTNGSRDAAVQELKALTMGFNQNNWILRPDGGRLAEHLARVHEEMNDFEHAIAWYEEAIQHPAGEAHIRSIERRAVLLDRYAALLDSEPKLAASAGTSVLETLEKAETDLLWLKVIQASSERWSLLGDHYVRRAALSAGDEREQALQDAHEHFASAMHRSKELDEMGWYKGEWHDPEPRASVLTRLVQLAALRGELQSLPSGKANPVRAVKTIKAQLAAWPTSHAGYRHGAGLAECELAEAMVDGAVAKRVEQLQALFLSASRARSTNPERQATIEHLKDLARLHPDPGEREALGAIAKGLEKAYQPTPS